MPKLKTRKSIAKRIKLTKKGKVLKKRAGQDHFNARESGKITRKKRRITKMSKANVRNIKAQLPYS
ncbi:MAG TPA: 50S ribosomal protein L35 [Candidatus Uhrbacteria bacterium]|nr:50S ribosomal protein L35 [Candidatus Uhrbacteria bacterium]